MPVWILLLLASCKWMTKGSPKETTSPSPGSESEQTSSEETKETSPLADKEAQLEEEKTEDTEKVARPIVQKRVSYRTARYMALLEEDRSTATVDYVEDEENLVLFKGEEKERFLFVHFAFDSPLDLARLQRVELECSFRLPKDLDQKLKLQLSGNQISWSTDAFSNFHMLPSLKPVAQVEKELSHDSKEGGFHSVFLKYRLDLTDWIRELLTKEKLAEEKKASKRSVLNLFLRLQKPEVSVPVLSGQKPKLIFLEEAN